MRSRTIAPTSLRLLVLAILIVSAGFLRSAAQRGAAVTLPVTRYELPAGYLGIFALSFDSIASDLLWIHYVQQMPDRPADPALGAALASELQAILDLDPQFRSAYLSGSILLVVLGNRPCDALDILERGIQRYPEDWRLPFQAGYDCFAEIGDPECAARYMTRAASLPGSPPWLPSLAARLLSDSTQHDAAIEYLTREIERATDPRLKARFEERLGEAYLAKDLARIDAAATRWRRERASEPASLQDLVASGYFPEGLSPWDPFGGTYELKDGRASTTSGRAGLTAFRRETNLVGTIEEKLLEESVLARLPADLGKPYWLHSTRDGLAASAGLVDYAIQGLESALRWAPEKGSDFRQIQARAMLRRDVDRLRKTWLAMLRDDPREKPTLAAIAAKAGVDPVDPFGTRYTFSDEGEPTTDPLRVALSPIVAGARRQELDKCR